MFYHMQFKKKSFRSRIHVNPSLYIMIFFDQYLLIFILPYTFDKYLSTTLRK